MNKFLIPLMLLCGLPFLVTAQNKDFNFQFPNTNLNAVAALPKEKRDSLVNVLNQLSPDKIKHTGQKLPANAEKAINNIMTEMLMVVKEVAKDPSSLQTMTAKMASLSSKMDRFGQDIDYEMQMKEAEDKYAADCKEAREEYAENNQGTRAERREAKKQLKEQLKEAKDRFQDEKDHILDERLRDLEERRRDEKDRKKEEGKG